MKNIDLSKWIFGGFLIFLGLGFFADQFFGISFGSVLSYGWPLAIMGLGAYIFIKARSQWMLSAIIFLVGTGLLVDRFVDLPFSIWNLWPLVLILVGVRILLGHSFNMNMSSTESKDEVVESVAVFWGDERRISSQNLKMVKVTSIFGGSELDLRDAKIAKDGAVIDMTAIFAGVSIKVSPDVLVKNESVGAFGAIEDRTSKPVKPAGTIIVKGVAMFGGVEIKN